MTIGILIRLANDFNKAGIKLTSVVNASLKLPQPTNFKSNVAAFVIDEKANTSEYPNGYKKNSKNPITHGMIKI